MHKALQAIVDTFLLAAGSVDLGSVGYAPSDHVRDKHRRAAPQPHRAAVEERAEPQPLVREPVFQANAKKNSL